MPDEPWQDAGTDDSQAYETNVEQGRPPDAGFRPFGSESRVRPAGRRIDTQYFVNWTAQPPPTDVREKCARCDHHVHQTEGDVPASEQAHADPGYWLDRGGLRFDNARVTGTELKREAHTFELPPDPPDPAEVVTISIWSRRAVNQVKDGIEWHRGDHMFPCVEGLPFSRYAGVFDLQPKLAQALATARLVASAARLTVMAASFAGLLARAAAGATEPVMEVRREGADRFLVVFERRASGELVELARQRLSVDATTGIVGGVAAEGPRRPRDDRSP